jgi:ABC-2 type transport system ATP-binding protein
MRSELTSAGLIVLVSSASRFTHIIAVMTDTRVIDEIPPAVTDGFAVQVRDLQMSYGPVQVLRGVDFEVRYGEVFCLLGPNGAGKTTTLEILEGFRSPTGGTVRVLGLDPAAQPARLRERAGMVLQECGFPRQARVAELIDIWRSYYPDPRPLADLLDVVELAEVRNTQVRKLSGGQRRRLDFALALAGDPDLIFLDEPTTGFDPEARRRCWTAIENLRGLGKTILLSTHYLDEAERLADRIAILRAGRIELAGTTQEVATLAGLATRISFITPAALRRGQVALPDGIDLAVCGQQSVCHADNAALALRRLLDWALEYRLGDLDGLAVTAPSLEDAYLQLAGAADGPAEPGRP